MALRAGRVGVNPSEVDTNGKIKGAGGSELEPRVSELETSISSFSFRNNEGQAQYKATKDGEWLNFSSGGLDYYDISNSPNKNVIILGPYSLNDLKKVVIYSDAEREQVIKECDINEYNSLLLVVDLNVRYYFRLLNSNGEALTIRTNSLGQVGVSENTHSFISLNPGAGVLLFLG